MFDLRAEPDAASTERSLLQAANAILCRNREEAWIVAFSSTSLALGTKLRTQRQAPRISMVELVHKIYDQNRFNDLR